MQLLAGVLVPDAGQVSLDDQLQCLESSAAARRAGVALVPQEAELACHLNVAENILLGCEPTRHGLIHRSTLREKAAQALEQVVAHERWIDCRRLAGDLSPSERQLVVIARAIVQDNLRVLIFDEPTSSLTAADVKQLFAVISRLKQRGIAILYVSHFLEEVLSVADRYCVLRDGNLVGSGKIADTSATELVTLMAGTVVTQRAHRAAADRGRYPPWTATRPRLCGFSKRTSVRFVDLLPQGLESC